MDYMWLEEQGLIVEPKPTKEDKLKYFEEYLTSIAARNRLMLKERYDTFISRGKAV